jgi:cytosine/adenosine deaminase-related metal-dependent hydrolase
VGTILKGATLVEFEPASVEAADLRIEGSRIVARGPALEPQEGDEVIPLQGRVVMPGLVSAHHRLCAALGRGLLRPPGRPADVLELEAATRWRLEDALDGDATEAGGAAGALEALYCGTTTVFDQHASPRAVRGALTRLARGINHVGLRAVLSWEVSDRSGPDVREDALVETVGFHHKARGRFRAMVGAAAACCLSREAMEGLQDAVKATGCAVHLSLGEDPVDERLSFERHGEVPLDRWMAHGLIGPRALVAHLVHLSWPQLAQVIATGAWLVHAPRANMAKQVGYAPAGKFGARATLGIEGQGGDTLAEAQVAHLRASEAGQPISILRYLANGHRIASEAFRELIGPLRPDATADLVVLDHRSPVPLDAENLEAQLASGFSSRQVEAVMVDGVWRLWARRPLSVDPDEVQAHARHAVEAVRARMNEVG